MSDKNQLDGVVIPFVPHPLDVTYTKRFDAANFSLVGQLYLAEVFVNIMNTGVWIFTAMANNFHDPKTLYGRLYFLGQNAQTLYDSGPNTQLIPGDDQPVVYSLGTPGGATTDPVMAAAWPKIVGVSGFFNVLDD